MRNLNWQNAAQDEAAYRELFFKYIGETPTQAEIDTFRARTPENKDQVIRGYAAAVRAG